MSTLEQFANSAANSPPNVSVFEASRLFLQTNTNLQQLSKRVRILRRRYQQNGRITQLREGQLQKVICLKLRSTSRKLPNQQESQHESCSIIRNTSLHFDRVRDTRETSRCLQRTLQLARHQDAQQMRLERNANRVRMLEIREQDLRCKKLRHEKIVQFRTAVKVHSEEHLHRKLLRTCQEKRRQVEQLLKLRDEKKELIDQLEKEKQNLTEVCNDAERMDRTIRMTLRNVTTAKSSSLVAKFRREHLTAHKDLQL